MEEAIQLAGLIGPTLIVLSISEALHISIWANVQASVVYLNGILLFIAGLSIIRTFNQWNYNWTLLITILGWASLFTGLYRIFLPTSPQLKKSFTTYIVLSLLLITGIFLSYKGYISEKANSTAVSIP